MAFGKNVVIIGAGPAGLTAAYELTKSPEYEVTVVEADKVVGGISRTAEYKGYLFDIGGHRFFTKVSLVHQMWKEVLADQFIRRPRLSRIYYNSKFFQYPLQPFDALRGLGLIETVRCLLSYAKAAAFQVRPEDNFEQWVSNRFGRRLFQIFFKSYTEKVWGIPCSVIRAEWAAQRIKGLSLRSAVLSALKKPASTKGDGVIKTLIHEFEYPKRGPGQMWDRTRDIVEQRGAKIVMEAPVERIHWEPGRVTAVEAGGRRYEGDEFISSMPIRELIQRLDPPPPERIRQAADYFKYRDFFTVVIILRDKDLFPDNWIYVHDPNVKVGRIQNFKNWSPDMVPDPATTCLGLEYFCFEGDGLWTTPESSLIELGYRELLQLGLARKDTFIDGTVVRMPKAYPIYDETYQLGLAAVRSFLEEIPNLQLVGRNGMHQYNNQDHSMLTAMLAARNIRGGRYDLWLANVDSDYHEEGREITEEELAALQSSQPRVPRAVTRG